MADGLELKRIVDLVAQTDIDEGVYTIIDSVSGAVKKYPLGSFICSVAPIFDATAAYAAGAYCNYNGQLYQFDDAHAAGAWTGEDATAVTLSQILGENGEDISTLLTQVAGKADADDVSGVIISNASGPIASFNDGADDLPVESLVVDIDPVQDLHGYDNPWPAGGGKNLLPDVSKSSSGYDVTVEFDDNSVTLTGTANSSGGRNVFRSEYFTLKAGTYYFKKFNVNTNGKATPGIYIQNDTTIVSDGGQFTLSSDSTKMNIGLNVDSGSEYNYYALFVVATEDITSYAPYENLCPISGWTGVDVTRCGKNLLRLVESEMVSAGYNRIFPYSIKEGSFVISCSGTFDGTNYGAVVNLMDSNDNLVKQIVTNYSFGKTGGNTYFEFTLTKAEAQKVAKVALYFSASGATYAMIENCKIMIEVGSSASSYEPYSGTVLPITWSSAGTVYGGYVNPITGVLTAIGVKDQFRIEDGYIVSEYFAEPTGVDVSVLGDNVRLAFNRRSQSSNMKAQSSSYTYKMSNIVKHAFNYNLDEPHWYINGQLYLYLPKSAVGTTLQEYKAYIASLISNGNSPSFWIELETPVTYQLTAQELKTLFGQNNIWATTGNVDVDYRADTKLYVDDQLPAVPATDGTYTLKCIVSDGAATLSWVEDQ